MAPSKKTMLFVCFLVAAAAVVVPAVAQGRLIGNLLSKLLDIQGILFCTANLNAAVGSGGIIVSPPFSNATVELRCGPGNGTVVSTAITDAAGQFSIALNLLTFPVTQISQILSGCRLVIATPLAKCNATLPSVGTLTSNLTSNGTINVGHISIPILKPIGFISVTL